MADVFLSYAREDVEIASKLADLLEANGLVVWWDRRLIAGDDIDGVIEKALETAKAVVVLWSPHSVESRWVRSEANLAADANKLVPVKIAECKLPLSFRGLHTPSIFASRQQIQELAQMLGAKLQPDTAPARNLELSTESTGKFLAEFKGLMLSPSSNLTDQFIRELEFGKRHPIAYWGGGLAIYALSVAGLVGLLSVDVQLANAIAVAIALVVYFAYRQYRLTRNSN